MLRRMVFAILTFGMLLGTAAQAQAAETGSIRVVLETGTQTVTSGSVTLYHAGVPAQGGYRLDEVFGGGLVRWGDLPSESLAPWLAEHVAAEGASLLLDADGSAEFPDLEPGLYLVKQHEAVAGYRTMEPFVVEVPYEDIWKITVLPKMEPITEEPPPTGQSAAPVIAAMVMFVSGLGLLGMTFGCRKTRKML
ncbi:MAG: prealbumin-like fold domain-containing protein [Faecousia sp.]